MKKNPRRKFPSRWRTVVPKHGKPTRYLWVVWHPKKLRLGKYTDIGAYSYLQALEGIEIGDHAQIGSHCALYSVSTIDGKKGKIVIGRNARIGSHSVIMPGVKIGANTVVGAMSFVNRDLPANALAYGCPVRIVKKREKS
jgi:acetyltransferase-like isoleucine patch superfamily enzyme